MQVVKRDGTREDVKIEKILHAVNRACRGLENVEALEVAKRTISGLHQGSTTQELDDLSIANAVMLMADEPNYSKVAARMQSEGIRKEVGRDLAFRDYIRASTELGLLSSQVLELVSQDFETIEFAIRHERDDLFEYFGIKTVTDRYLLRHPKTRKLIERPQWLFMRVALGLSNSVKEGIELYDIISQFLYMPATPTLFNSGTRHPQMSSCYLLTVAEDSLEGIYKSITDCAKLSKFSGGIGIDWTPVRSSGALIRGTNGLSNGIIPFLKVFDSSVHAVNQGGKRKGAAAIYLEPWHGDIETFLDLRNNTGSEERRTHNLNLALWIPDLFMRRVEADGKWSLFSPSDAPDLLTTFGQEFDAAYEKYETEGKFMKQISARSLYARMMQTLAETGNGWMCFKDKANLRSAQTGQHNRVVRSSNLCTEILEIANQKETAVCNLGSLNLVNYVKPDRTFDYAKLELVARTAVRFLDRVVDRNFYPTTESKTSNEQWRPIGLGVMGLQDALFKMGLPFTSDEAKRVSSRIQETVYYSAIKQSIELAEKFGPFANFRESRYAEGKLQPQLAQDLQAVMPEFNYDWEGLAREVRTKGLRNSLLIAVAPTATIASIVGSYESIEPQISNIFKRETLSGEFLQVNRYLISDLKRAGLWSQEMKSKIIEAEGSIQDIVEIPQAIRELYKTTWEIAQKDLIDMAVLRSPFICQSQSLNLFVEEVNLGKLSSMYMYAWKQGVKTTYYLRSRAKTSIKKTTVGSTAGAGATSAGPAMPVGTGGATDAASAQATAQAAVVCSLENPETCEACQ
jgi:ribonucleoside-diphosphate reductase alpha chain